MGPSAATAATASICALLLAGCGTATGPAATPDPRQETEAPLPDGLERPPDLRVKAADGWVDVSPHTWCWGNGCVDGVPPDPLPDLGTADAPLLLEVPAGWQVLHSWSPVGTDCGPQLRGTTVTGAGAPVELEPLGAAGEWQLDVMVRPPEGGDVVAAMGLTTSQDHPLPEPELRLTSFFDHDGTVVQYGPLELAGSYLPPALLDAGPDGTKAVLTVRSADGRTSTIDLHPATRPDDACQEPSTVLLRERGRGQGSSEHAVEDDLGEPPYQLTLELHLAGASYTGTATWPDDVDEEDSTIRPEMTPKLPRPEPGDLSP